MARTDSPGGEPQPASSPIHRRDLVIFLLTLLVVVATLGQVLGNGFVWDDVFLVRYANSLGDFSSLGETLSNPFWMNSSYISPKGIDFWRPVTSLVLWLGGLVFGKSPAGFHFISLLVLFTMGGSFALLLRRMVPSTSAPLLPWWLALLFVAHPISAEVLSMVANMSDHLAFLFLTWEIIFLLDAQRGDSPGRDYALAALMGFLAAGSKELGVISVAMPLFAWGFGRLSERRPARSRLARPWPWVAAVLPVIVYAVLRTLVMRSAGHATHPTAHASLSIETVLIGWWELVRHLFAPSPHGAEILVDPGSLAARIPTALAWLGLVAIVARAVVRRRLDLTVLGLALSLLLLIPPMLIVERDPQGLFYSTRYFHLPLAGLIIGLVPFVEKRWSRGIRLAVPLFVGLLCILSWIRISEWSDEVSFYSAETSYNPIPRNHLNLAFVLIENGAFSKAQEVLDDTGKLPNASLPGVASRIESARGKIALIRDGDLDLAARHAKKALDLNPRDLVCVLDLALVFKARGDVEQALALLEEAQSKSWFNDHQRRAIVRKIAEYEEAQNN